MSANDKANEGLQIQRNPANIEDADVRYIGDGIIQDPSTMKAPQFEYDLNTTDNEIASMRKGADMARDLQDMGVIRKNYERAKHLLSTFGQATGDLSDGLISAGIISTSEAPLDAISESAKEAYNTANRLREGFRNGTLTEKETEEYRNALEILRQPADLRKPKQVTTGSLNNAPLNLPRLTDLTNEQFISTAIGDIKRAKAASERSRQGPVHDFISTDAGKVWKALSALDMSENITDEDVKEVTDNWNNLRQLAMGDSEDPNKPDLINSVVGLSSGLSKLTWDGLKSYSGNPTQFLADVVQSLPVLTVPGAVASAGGAYSRATVAGYEDDDKKVSLKNKLPTAEELKTTGDAAFANAAVDFAGNYLLSRITNVGSLKNILGIDTKTAKALSEKAKKNLSGALGDVVKHAGGGALVNVAQGALQYDLENVQARNKKQIEEKDSRDFAESLAQEGALGVALGMPLRKAFSGSKKVAKEASTDAYSRLKARQEAQRVAEEEVKGFEAEQPEVTPETTQEATPDSTVEPTAKAGPEVTKEPIKKVTPEVVSDAVTRDQISRSTGRDKHLVKNIKAALDSGSDLTNVPNELNQMDSDAYSKAAEESINDLDKEYKKSAKEEAKQSEPTAEPTADVDVSGKPSKSSSAIFKRMSDIYGSVLQTHNKLVDTYHDTVMDYEEALKQGHKNLANKLKQEADILKQKVDSSKKSIDGMKSKFKANTKEIRDSINSLKKSKNKNKDKAKKTSNRLFGSFAINPEAFSNADIDVMLNYGNLGEAKSRALRAEKAIRESIAQLSLNSESKLHHIDQTFLANLASLKRRAFEGDTYALEDIKRIMDTRTAKYEQASQIYKNLKGNEKVELGRYFKIHVGSIDAVNTWGLEASIAKITHNILTGNPDLTPLPLTESKRRKDKAKNQQQQQQRQAVSEPVFRQKVVNDYINDFRRSYTKNELRQIVPKLSEQEIQAIWNGRINVRQDVVNEWASKPHKSVKISDLQKAGLSGSEMNKVISLRKQKYLEDRASLHEALINKPDRLTREETASLTTEEKQIITAGRKRRLEKELGEKQAKQSKQVDPNDREAYIQSLIDKPERITKAEASSLTPEEKAKVIKGRDARIKREGMLDEKYSKASDTVLEALKAGSSISEVEAELNKLPKNRRDTATIETVGRYFHEGDFGNSDNTRLTDLGNKARLALQRVKAEKNNVRDDETVRLTKIVAGIKSRLDKFRAEQAKPETESVKPKSVEEKSEYDDYLRREDDTQEDFDPDILDQLYEEPKAEEPVQKSAKEKAIERTEQLAEQPVTKSEVPKETKKAKQTKPLTTHRSAIVSSLLKSIFNNAANVDKFHDKIKENIASKSSHPLGILNEIHKFIGKLTPEQIEANREDVQRLINIANQILNMVGGDSLNLTPSNKLVRKLNTKYKGNSVELIKNAVNAINQEANKKGLEVIGEVSDFQNAVVSEEHDRYAREIPVVNKAELKSQDADTNTNVAPETFAEQTEGLNADHPIIDSEEADNADTPNEAGEEIPNLLGETSGEINENSIAHRLTKGLGEDVNKDVPYSEQNFIAKFFQQGDKDSELSTNGNLINELSTNPEAVLDKIYGSRPYDKPKALRTIQAYLKFNNEFRKAFESTFQPTPKYTKYNYLSSLADANGKLPEEVMNALTATAFNWVLNDGIKTKFLTHRKLEQFFGDTKSPFYKSSVYNLLDGYHTRRTTTIDKLGKGAVDILNLVPTKDGLANAKSLLEQSIGGAIYTSLIHSNYIKENRLLVGNIEKALGRVPKNFANYSKAAELPLVKLMSPSDKSHLLNLKDIDSQFIREFTKNDLFGSFINYEPKKAIFKKLGANSYISKGIARILGKDQQRPVKVLKDNFTSFLDQFTHEERLEMYGLRDLDDVEVPADYIGSLAGTDQGIRDALDVLYKLNDELLSQEKGLDTEYFYTHAPWQNGRFGIVGSLNPQSNKALRAFMGHTEWSQSLDFSKKQFDTNHDNWVKITLASNGFDMPADKKSESTILKEFEDKIQEPAIRQAIETLKRVARDPDYRLNESERRTVINGVAEAGETAKSYAALMELAKYELAKENKTVYEHRLAREVDGITNGVFLTLLQSSNDPKYTMELLRNTGVNFSPDQSFTQYIAEGRHDLYQSLAYNWNKSIESDIRNGVYSTELVDALGKVIDPFVDANGKVTKAGRNYAKPVLMQFMYSAGIPSLMKSMVADALKDGYEKITQISIDFRDYRRELANDFALDDNERNRLINEQHSIAVGKVNEIINNFNAITKLDQKFPAQIPNIKHLKDVDGIKLLEEKFYNQMYSTFSKVYGNSVGEALNTDYPSVIEYRNQINHMVSGLVTLFNSEFDRRSQLVIDKKINDLAQDIADGKISKSDIGLTLAEERTLLKELEGFAPSIHTADAVYQGKLELKSTLDNLESRYKKKKITKRKYDEEVNKAVDYYFESIKNNRANIGESESAKLSGSNSTVAQKQLFKTPVQFSKNKSDKPIKSIANNARSRRLSATAGALAFMAHVTDAAINLGIKDYFSTLNVHDASYMGYEGGKFNKNVQRYNQTAFEVNKAFNAFEEMAEKARLSIGLIKENPSIMKPIIEGVLSHARQEAVAEKTEDRSNYNASFREIHDTFDSMFSYISPRTGKRVKFSDLITKEFLYETGTDLSSVDPTKFKEQIDEFSINPNKLNKFLDASYKDIKKRSDFYKENKDTLLNSMHSLEQYRNGSDQAYVVDKANKDIFTNVDDAIANHADRLNEFKDNETKLREFAQEAKDNNLSSIDYLNKLLADVNNDPNLLSENARAALQNKSDWKKLMDEFHQEAKDNGFKSSLDYARNLYADNGNSTKDLHVVANALLKKHGTAPQAKVSKPKADGFKGSSSDTSAMEGHAFGDAKKVNSLNYADTFETIVVDSKGKDSEEHISHLRSVIKNVVAKVTDPINLYYSKKEGISQALGMTNGEDMFILNYVNNDKPYNSSLFGSNKMSAAEVFAHESVHNVTSFALDNNYVLRNQTRKLWEQARTVMTYKDFMPKGMTKTDPRYREERRIAKANYNHIFQPRITGRKAGLGVSDHLHEFVSFGVTNENFRKLLDDRLSSTANISGATFSAKLMDVFNKSLQVIQNLFKGQFNLKEGLNKKGSAKVDDLFKKLANSQSKAKQHTITARAVETVKSVGDILKEADRTANLATKAIKGYDLALKPHKAAIDIIFAGSERLADYLHSKNNKFANELGKLLTEMNSRTGLNSDLINLHRKLKNDIDIARENLENSTMIAIKKEFSRELTEPEESALTNVILRADIGAIESVLGPERLNKMIHSTEELNGWIGAVEKKLSKLDKHQGLTAQAKNLGLFMATGKSLLHLGLTNVDAIADISKDSTEQTVHEISALASMYALKYTSEADMNMYRNLDLKEKNGINFARELTKRYREVEREEFSDNPYALMKGYTTSVDDPTVSVKVGNLADHETIMDLESKGYKPAFPVSDKSTTWVWVNKSGELAPYLQGTAYLNTETTRGSVMEFSNTDAKYEYLNEAYRKTIGQYMNGIDPTDDVNKPMAVLDSEGDIDGARHMMTHASRKAVLNTDTTFSRTFAVMQSRLEAKKLIREGNTELFNIIRKTYLEDYSQNPKMFVHIDLESEDPEIARIAKMLPPELVKLRKQDNAVLVRKDQLDLLFGYRKADIRNVLFKNPKYRNKFTNDVVGILGKVFDVDNHTVLHKLVSANDMYKEVVKFTKDTIIIKSAIVTVHNTLANIGQLFASGVSLKDITTGYRQAYVSLNQFRNDSAELQQINLRLSKATLSNSQRVKLANRKLHLEDALAFNPARELIEQGALPTIVDDVDVKSNIYPHLTKLKKVLSSPKFIQNASEKTKSTASNLLAMQGSQTYKVLSDLAQFTDFGARFVRYKDLKENKNYSSEQAMARAMDEFIDYDIPSSKLMEGLNNYGIAWFAKYKMRIQKVILNTMRDNPIRMLGFLAGLQSLLPAGDSLWDSFMWNNSLLNNLNNPFTYIPKKALSPIYSTSAVGELYNSI